MSNTTYISLINKLKGFANAHFQIKRIGFDFDEQSEDFYVKSDEFPAVFVSLNSIDTDVNINTITVTIECLDRIAEDRKNINYVTSDCSLILNDIYLWLADGDDVSFSVTTPPQSTPLNNVKLDYCAGAEMSISIEVDNYTVCAIPMGEIPEPTPNCEDATYELTIDGLTVDSGSIASGENAVIPIDEFINTCTDALLDEDGNFILDEDGNCISGEASVCEDATYVVKYEDETPIQSGSVASGGSVTVIVPNCPTPEPCEDATAVLRDTNNDVISTTIIPSGGSEDITAPDGNIEINSVQFDTVVSGGTKNVNVLQSTGATEVGSIQGQYFRIGDSTVNVNKSDSTLISAVTVKAEDTTSYNVADSVVNVNSVKLADVKATDTLNISVVDSTDSSVSVTLSGGNKITIPSLPCAAPTVRNAALPLPTGQTDVSVSAKQLTSWLVLKENNPFGNTNRFTDTLGGSTYANGIAIDWAHSSDDDEVVMGWFLTPESNNYANLIAGEPYTKASLSGWYMLDIQELFGLLYWGNGVAGHCLNYAPFNYIVNSNTTRIKTRTNEPSDALDTMVYVATDQITPIVKTQSNSTFLRRLFTYAELGL